MYSYVHCAMVQASYFVKFKALNSASIVNIP